MVHARQLLLAEDLLAGTQTYVAYNGQWAGTAGTGAYNNEDAVGASLYSHSWERVLQGAGLLSNRCTPIAGREGIRYCNVMGIAKQDILP